MMEASLYDKIMDQQRLEPEFFRVGFYGKKFPFFLRVKKSPYCLFVLFLFVDSKLNSHYFFSFFKEEIDLQEEWTFLI